MTSKILLDLAAKADQNYEATFDFTPQRRKRNEQKKALTVAHYHEKIADALQNNTTKKKNAKERELQLEGLMQRHNQEAMEEEDIDSRRRFWQINKQAEDVEMAAQRIYRSRTTTEGFVSQAVVYELRSRNIDRIFLQLRTFVKDPAVISTGFTELSLFIGESPSACQALVACKGISLIVAAFQMHKNNFPVIEQGSYLILKLCSSEICIKPLMEEGILKIICNMLAKEDLMAMQALAVVVLRVVVSIYERAAKMKAKYYAAKDEQEVMRLIIRIMERQTYNPDIQEMAIQAMTSLVHGLDEHLLYLDKINFLKLLECMQPIYSKPNYRFPRSKAAAVAREVVRFFQHLALGCDSNSLADLLNNNDIINMVVVITSGHSRDPFVQIMAAGFWEAIFGKHQKLFSDKFSSYGPQLLQSFLEIIPSYLTFKDLIWRVLVDMNLLYAADRTVYSTFISSGGVKVLEITLAECSSDSVLFERTMQLLLAYCKEPKVVFACLADEVEIIEELRKALKLHPDNKPIQDLGRKTLVTLRAQAHV